MPNPTGRPPKLTPVVQRKIAEMLFDGFSDQEIATFCQLNERTIRRARDRFCPAIKRGVIARKAHYIRKLRDGTRPDWQRIAWFLERRYPKEFSRPEIQLAVNQTLNSGPTNVLVIGPERAGLLAQRYEQIRACTLKLLNQSEPKEANAIEGSIP